MMVMVFLATKQLTNNGSIIILSANDYEEAKLEMIKYKLSKDAVEELTSALRQIAEMRGKRLKEAKDEVERWIDKINELHDEIDGETGNEDDGDGEGNEDDNSQAGGNGEAEANGDDDAPAEGNGDDDAPADDNAPAVGDEDDEQYSDHESENSRQKATTLNFAKSPSHATIGKLADNIAMDKGAKSCDSSIDTSSSESSGEVWKA